MPQLKLMTHSRASISVSSSASQMRASLLSIRGECENYTWGWCTYKQVLQAILRFDETGIAHLHHICHRTSRSESFPGVSCTCVERRKQPQSITMFAQVKEQLV